MARKDKEKGTKTEPPPDKTIKPEPKPEVHVHRAWYAKNQPVELVIHWTSCIECQKDMPFPLETVAQ